MCVGYLKFLSSVMSAVYDGQSTINTFLKWSVFGEASE
jgi:hypothetical protein